MDLSKEERSVNAADSYVYTEISERERNLIANVLHRTKPGIDRMMVLGSICPYEAANKRKRAAWCAEIDRQETAQLCIS